MSDDAYNMTWWQAKELGEQGYRVRPIDAGFWYESDGLAWYTVTVSEAGVEARRLVLMSEFGPREYRLNNWTTAPWNVNDPCLRPPEIAPVYPERTGVMGLIEFQWAPADGQDLDVRVAFDSFAVDLDGRDVGWGSSRSVIIPGPSGKYLWWPDNGDNTGTSGPETVRVDLEAIEADYPAALAVKLRLRGNWYVTRDLGNVTISFRKILGGEWFQNAGNWFNAGGRELSSISVIRNITSHDGSDVDGSSAGFLIYNFETREGSFTT